MNTLMTKSRFNIGSWIVLLTVGMLVSALPATAPAYNNVTNPVFYSILDDQGGAWDTVTWYPTESVDLLSGNWRANLRIGSSQAWIDPAYFAATSVVTGPAPPGSISGGVGSVTSTLVNTAGSPYGLPAGAVTIEMDVRSVPWTTHLGLGGNSYVVSEPWVIRETYTVINTGDSVLEDLAFYQYYFPSPYGRYPDNVRPSHVDYTASIGDPAGYTFDITLYGEGGPNWAYTGLSTNISPTAHDVGHGAGYPDPPYYFPSPPWRPSAISTDVLRQVEADTLRGWASYSAPSGSDPSAVAGAFKWDIDSLAPGDSYTITFLQSVAPHDAPKHTPPSADAGPDQTVEQDSHAGASVTLDGSGSSDPDGDPLTYTWTWSGGSASGVNPTVTLPLGTTTVTLTVDDGGLTDSDTVGITVEDTTDPVVTIISVNPEELWPPNHKMVPVIVLIEAEDICTETGLLEVSVTVTSNEPDDDKGDGAFTGDVDGQDGFTAPVPVTCVFDEEAGCFVSTFALRAERDGRGDGRVYTIEAVCEDASGNIATATETMEVTVVHDQGKGKE